MNQTDALSHLIWINKVSTVPTLLELLNNIVRIRVQESLDQKSMVDIISILRDIEPYKWLKFDKKYKKIELNNKKMLGAEIDILREYITSICYTTFETINQNRIDNNDPLLLWFSLLTDDEYNPHWHNLVFWIVEWPRDIVLSSIENTINSIIKYVQ